MNVSKFAEFGGPNQEYRYALWRIWSLNKGYIQFIGLNPSTADDKIDDATIRRCISYTKQWGYGGFCMTNLFAFRATQPKVMLAASDPIGPENDGWLKAAAEEAEIIVACWGTQGTHQGRDQIVMGLVPGMKCLKITKDGHPHHPLRLPDGIIPLEFSHEAIRNHLEARDAEV